MGDSIFYAAGVVRVKKLYLHHTTSLGLMGKLLAKFMHKPCLGELQYLI